MHEIYIDYFVVSVDMSERDLVTSGVEDINPIPFYKRGYRDKLGKRYYFGHAKTSKAHVVMSGQYLHNSRVVGWRDIDTVRAELDNHASVKRMDIAITDYVEDDLITPEHIAMLTSQGRVSGAMAEYGAKVIASVSEDNDYDVETTYIGDITKRGKKGIFRAYDKGLELGIMKDIIARLELEERGDNAHMSAKRFTEGASLTQIVESRIQFDCDRVNRFFTEDAIDISRGDAIIGESDHERMEKRYAWLMNQVAPALREFTQYERDNNKGDQRIMAFLRKCGIIE